MKIGWISSLLFALAVAALPSLSKAQSSTDIRNSSTTASPVTPTQPPKLVYTRPTGKMKFRSYLFDTFGPYPILGSAAAAGINQASDSPPEWQQGAEGYGKRFGSNFGIAAVSTTTRYALAEVFREDTLYYRCECKGMFPRLRHAVLSTVTTRRGDDGHSAFSFTNLVSPYAGTMTGVYAWFPDRYNAKDAFRMGNYNLLGFVGGNVAREFLFNLPNALLTRAHLKNGNRTPDPNSKP